MDWTTDVLAWDHHLLRINIIVLAIICVALLAWVNRGDS